MSTIIDLSTLGSRGFVIQGDAVDDHLGDCVSVGDVNGDGIADIIVGAPRWDGGGPDAGAAYVIFGRKGRSGTIDLTALAPADGFVILGDNPTDLAGRSVSFAGDVNGDGIGDIVVGAPGGDDGGTDAGEAYVVLGRPGGGGPVELTGLPPAAGFVIQGHAYGDGAGWSVAAGDVNGDGLDDLIVGAPWSDGADTFAGKAYVVFGKAGGFAPVDLSALPAADGFAIHGTAGSSAGISVSGAGDVNGDGFDDIVVGASGGGEGGRAFILFGKESGFGTVDLATLAVADGIAVSGGSGFGLGYGVSSAGDVNGDGFDDVILGAPGANGTGAAYVLFGKAGGFRPLNVAALAPADGFAIVGGASFDNAGFDVASAGDVNGDGFDDVIVGAPYGDGGGLDAGAAFVVFGKAGGFGTVNLASLAPADGFVIQGDAAGDVAGRNVAAGDVNGDGLDDLILGAYRGDDGGFDAGETYVVFGMLPTTSVTRIGSVIGQTIRGGIGDDLLDGRDGDDVLLAAAGDDELIGGAGNDTLDGGDGDDALGGGSGRDALRGGAGIDSLTGGSGNDGLNGGSGGDALDGGSGNDRFHVDSRGDRVVEQEGGGSDRVLASISYTLGRGMEIEALTTSSNAGVKAINLTGNEFANRLTGNAGANVLDGAGGADTLAGLGGNDTYRVDSGGDRIVETGGGGADRLLAGASYALASGVSVESLATSDAGGTHTINLTGNEIANKITGNAGANALRGGGGGDTLSGLAGNDQLHGGSGRDLMVGGHGADRFYFDTSLGPGNVDTIAHFVVADDTLYLDRAIFAAVSANGRLADAAFHVGAAAADASDRIVYDRPNGDVYYDPDGSGAAGQILFARVADGTALTRADFVAFSAATARSDAAAGVDYGLMRTDSPLLAEASWPGHLPSAMHWMDLVVP